MYRQNLQLGDVVSLNGVAGIIAHIENGDALAYILWPSGCGIGDWQPIESLTFVAGREYIVEALQEIVPAPVRRQLNPFEQAFRNALQPQQTTIIDGYIDDDSNRQRPYLMRRNGR